MIHPPHPGIIPTTFQNVVMYKKYKKTSRDHRIQLPYSNIRTTPQDYWPNLQVEMESWYSYVEKEKKSSTVIRALPIGSDV
jgi:hypothetical protein